MSKRSRTNIDWIILGCTLLLIVIGWFSIYAAEYEEGQQLALFNFGSSVSKQFYFSIVGLIVIFLCHLTEASFWRTIAFPLYFVSLILLILVLLIGTEVKGATSWFSLGLFSFQPAELAKVSTILALGAYLAYYKTDLKELGSRMTAVSLFFAPIMLILLQPDAGSALVFASLFLVLLVAGFNPLWYILFAICAATAILSIKFDGNVVVYALLMLAVVFYIFNLSNKMPWIFSSILLFIVAIILYLENLFIWGALLLILLLIVHTLFLYRSNKARILIVSWPLIFVFCGLALGVDFMFENLLQPHQQDRILVWLRPDECDPRGPLYNVIQSKMTIGSGGLSGKGYLEGTMTQYNYVPEQSTDFIFCTIGEEFGFIGTSAVILLYFTLIIRMTVVAEKLKGPFEKYYSYGLASILFTHILINIGMTIGLMPVIGIPLPFVSYGGSSLLIFCLAIGILLTFAKHRSTV